MSSSGAAAPAICLYTDSGAPSGAGEHMLALAAGLRARHCRRVSLVCPPTPEGRALLGRAAALGLEAAGIEPPSWDGATESRLAAWLRGHRPDLFHLHAGIAWEGWAAPLAARAAGVPLVVRTEHLPYVLDEPFQRAVHAEVAAMVDRIVCVSEAARASYLAAGLPPALVSVVRNGIPPLPEPRAARAEVRAELGIGPEAPLFLTVARLVEQKGHAVLLDAVPTVLGQLASGSAAPPPSSRPAGEPAVTRGEGGSRDRGWPAPGRAAHARFAWVGTGPLEGALRDAVRARGLEEAVLLLGQRADVPDLLAAADAFVLPSRFEGLPIAALEAMAAGLPVVATRVCGTAEVVLDGETGLLVPPDDPAALASALLRVAARPGWARRLGEAGRVRAAAEFGAGRMVDETLALYRELLKVEA